MVSCLHGSFGRRGPQTQQKIPKIINCLDSNLMFFLHWQIAQPFAVQDEFTRKTQDLNPECIEDLSPIMQLGVKLGIEQIFPKLLLGIWSLPLCSGCGSVSGSMILTAVSTIGTYLFSIFKRKIVLSTWLRFKTSRWHGTHLWTT